MKFRKRLGAFCLCVIMLALMIPQAVFAVGKIDLNREASLQISCRAQETPLVGAEFRLYLVATADEYAQLTAAEDFEEFRTELTDTEDFSDMASTLESVILRDEIAPSAIAKTDENGVANFEKLPVGLYLVLGERHIQGKFSYDALPYLLMLPERTAENTWNYDVTAQSKHTSEALPETVTRKVLKVWKDSGEANRPKEVTVQLFRDGKLYDTVTLNAENNWRHTWEDLDGASVWKVAEKKVSGYTAKITREGVTFVVTNTAGGGGSGSSGGSSPSEKLPQTGQPWWQVGALLCGGLLLIVIGLWRRKGAGDAR